MMPWWGCGDKENRTYETDGTDETEAPAAFGYKQLLHEPFMGGGGLWTSSAVFIVWRYGGPAVLGISLGAIAVWLLVWWLFLRPKCEV